MEAEPTEPAVKKEIYTHRAPWLIYAANWSFRQDKPFRLAIGSFREDNTNRVEGIQLNDAKPQSEVKGSSDHPGPPANMAWTPGKAGRGAEVLATGGDYLRVWEAKETGGVE